MAKAEEAGRGKTLSRTSPRSGEAAFFVDAMGAVPESRSSAGVLLGVVAEGRSTLGFALVADSVAWLAAGSDEVVRFGVEAARSFEFDDEC